MRVLALVPYPYDTAPGQRYRIEQWDPLLKQSGIQITYEPFRSDALHSLLSRPGNTSKKVLLTALESVLRLKVLRQINDYDLVYIYKEVALVGPALIEHYIGLKNVPMVFDFDDAIYLHSPYGTPANRYFRLLKFPGKTREICSLASHVIVGNAYLAEYASRFNRNVTIVPSTIDTKKYELNGLRPKGKRRPVIGWSGSYSTLPHFDIVRRALTRLAKKEQFRIRMIGTATDYEIDGVDVETILWQPETEVADLAPIDIGIMPLPDDEWTRGKCGQKALQYMALGIPTVCSPVGANSTIIKDEENGLLAETEDQWVEQLTRLLHSQSLRERLGKAGRATIEAGYSLSLHAPRVRQVFESAVKQAGQAIRREP
jgi:glycosyltransferase involved in cell wall biosynthesis